jgi:hypothetical protein
MNSCGGAQVGYIAHGGSILEQANANIANDVTRPCSAIHYILAVLERRENDTRLVGKRDYEEPFKTKMLHT